MKSTRNGDEMETNLNDILKKKKPAILKKWFAAILETYPPEAAAFYKGQKNKFTGPVGYTIYEGIEGLIDGLINEAPFEEVSPFLDSIVKIRAVQDFSASQAVSFIFDLKWIIREELQKMSNARGVADATLSAFESRIDALVLISFDMYMESREKLYELKSNQARSMAFRLLQREYQSYEMHEMQGQGPSIETQNLK